MLLTIISIVFYISMTQLMNDEDRRKTYQLTILVALFLLAFKASAAVERPVFKGYAPKLYILQACDSKKDKTCDSRGFKLVESAASRLLYKLQVKQLNKGK